MEKRDYEMLYNKTSIGLFLKSKRLECVGG